MKVFFFLIKIWLLPDNFNGRKTFKYHQLNIGKLRMKTWRYYTWKFCNWADILKGRAMGKCSIVNWLRAFWKQIQPSPGKPLVTVPDMWRRWWLAPLTPYLSPSKMFLCQISTVALWLQCDIEFVFVWLLLTHSPPVTLYTVHLEKLKVTLSVMCGVGLINGGAWQCHLTNVSPCLAEEMGPFASA